MYKRKKAKIHSCHILTFFFRVTQSKKLYSLTEDYNKALPPTLPTKVNIEFKVAEIVDVDDKRHVSKIKRVSFLYI